ncbi:BREX-1 system phosphatase PglZ type A [Shewanella algae]|uniref:BREX-1 system phosphatase PglZ type A n=1 Tax=Shewanella algae TaxID=38313 RepID=UPI001AAF3284|nr:BREX-1 system phosphatase PglZ type A [Shewanella algae]EKT4487389.1 BREX-1 system phosphatase PglZ type A [Shewanella algae]MBO2546547.1 BREX-1 system phosphatase PglZ type A [Shewanella algae]
MDISQLEQGLNKKFSESRIVFWHDPDQSFTDVLPELSLWHQDKPVCVLNMAHESQLEVRCRIDMHETESAFLLYWPSAEPVAAQDWLLDMRCYSETFYADAASIILNELGLHDMSLREHIAARQGFFASQERLKTLKARIDGRSGQETALTLDMKIISVLLGCKANYPDMLMTLCSLMVDEDDSAIHKELALLEKHGVLTSFWALMAEQFDYLLPEDNDDDGIKPTLNDLLRRMLVSECYELMDGARPQWMKGQLLANPSGRANAMHLLGLWRDSSRYGEDYRVLAARIAGQLELGSRLSALEPQQLLAVETFEAVEQLLIRALVDDLQAGLLVFSRADFAMLLSRRRQMYWARTTPKYGRLYQALSHAEQLFDLRRRFPDGFHFPSAQAMYLAYEKELHQFDASYRLFNEAAEALQGQTVEILASLDAAIEDLYVNWYLYQLGLAWDGLLAKEQKLESWQFGVPSQQHFFETNVRPRLAQSGVRRQFVIISDALRYEIAKELQSEINQAKRFSAQLKSQVSVLPSYTQLGMAALLPHKQLDYSADGATVLVDGKSTAGLANRSAVLQSVGGLALSAKELMGLTRAQANEAVGDASVIYIYHDVIDAIGDKAATEHQTFIAARRAIEELQALVAKVINGFGVTRVLVTADHGFLFQQASPEVGVKSGLLHEPAGTVEAKKRYLLGRNLPEHDDVWHGRLAQIIAGSTDMEFYLPRGVSRFHFVGGARFVHGGAMLQEICVPVLEVQELRGKKQQQNEKLKVGVVPAQQPIKLVNAIDKIRFLQTDAVGDRFKGRSVRFCVLDDSGQSVSAIERATFESASQSLDERAQDVRLKLTAEQYDRKVHYQLVLTDDEEGIELARYPVTIDLAFSNDFGF